MNHTTQSAPASECVAFDSAQKTDSHAAFDPATKTYTFVMDGHYIIKDGSSIRKAFKKAGETLKDIDWVVGEHCGVFYKSAEKKATK